MLIIIYYIFTISLAIITHYFQMIIIFLIYTVLVFLKVENMSFFSFSLNLNSALTVNMLLEILETKFSHLEKDNNNNSLVDFLEKLNEIVHLTSLAQCLAHIKCYSFSPSQRGRLTNIN